MELTINKLTEERNELIARKEAGDFSKKDEEKLKELENDINEILEDYGY